jgi:hypothetical protein
MIFTPAYRSHSQHGLSRFITRPETALQQSGASYAEFMTLYVFLCRNTTERAITSDPKGGNLPVDACGAGWQLARELHDGDIARYPWLKQAVDAISRDGIYRYEMSAQFEEIEGRH